MKRFILLIIFTIALFAYLNKDLIMASLYLKDSNPNNDKLVNNKNVDAAFLLGYYYKSSKYNDINLNKSFYYYKLASNLGDKKAKMILSWYYYKGIGVKKSKDKAIQLLKELAIDGDDNAIEILKFVISN